jgi:hypothetical protein
MLPLEGAVSVDFNHSLVSILSSMPRSDTLVAIDETKPLLLEDAATDGETLPIK